MRNDTEYGLTRFFLKEVECRGQQRHIPTEFIDDKPLNESTFLCVKQFKCPNERGKRTAAVDIRDEEDGCLQMLRHSHIDDIIRLEIDLGGTACSLNHEQIVFRTEAIKCLFDSPPRLE